MAKKKKSVKKKPVAKKKAAKKKAVKRGGFREGAGRKALIPGGVAKKSFSLFPKHLKYLEAQKKKRGLSSDSEVLREMLDELAA